jgi:antitoxin MazE
MKTHIQKWGNSLALRIPKSFATETHLVQGTRVESTVHDGKLINRASARLSYDPGRAPQGRHHREPA